MKNQKMIVCRGLPSSGKSSWAKEFLKRNKNYVEINRDNIRLGLGQDFSKPYEKLVKDIRDYSIRIALLGGFSIISSDCNLDPSHLEKFLGIRNDIDPSIEMEVKIFDTSLEECLARNERRAEKIPAKAIVDMWKKYVKPYMPVQGHPTYYPHSNDLPYAYQFDIDGTLALKGDRHIFDYSKVHLDLPHLPVVSIAKRLYKDGYKLIFMSGREDSCRSQTEEWLRENLGIRGILTLFMRKTGDHRKDSYIKKELWEEHIKDKFNILGIFEDRSSVVKMWRSLGLFVCQVAEGEF